MSASAFQAIKQNLRQLYLEDPRPCLVGFSGGKDSTMVASLIFDAVLSVPAEQRIKPVSILCTDTRVEIPAIVEMVERTLAKMRKFSTANELNIDVVLLRPPGEQSFWVNVIGRGYPPPNRGSDRSRPLTQGAPRMLFEKLLALPVQTQHSLASGREFRYIQEQWEKDRIQKVWWSFAA